MSTEKQKSYNEIDTIPNMKVENSKKIFSIITIIVLILTIYGKLASIGWYTLILSWIGLIPAQLILFTIAGKSFAKMNNKTIDLYIMYVLLCITSLLYSFTFVDGGDIDGPYTALSRNIQNENFLYKISVISYISNIVLAIIIIVKSTRKSKNKNITQ